ncbi:MAG: family 20 glycosylhydrolase [Eubacteriales bacterium]|nr:family 20 glycosylhydrolase [Eubacteriales bacterium]
MIPKINGNETIREEMAVLPNPLTVQNEFSDTATAAFRERMGRKGFQVTAADGGFLRIRKQEAMEKEAYFLSVRRERIEIEAADETGVIWALTTLLKKINPDGSVQAGMIQDAPKFRHRGLHLDVARHFFSAGEVERILEQISLAKMNVLHWHLADDQGWRIESKKYPKLHTCSGQYYTQEEIREVVAFARTRGVEVIPEIDLPGHTRGILAAYPEYSCSGRTVKLAKAGGIYRVIFCAGAEKTYAFLEELLEEVCPLFPSERFHIGGDEAPKAEWQECPVCAARMAEQKLTRYEDLQGYFSVRVAEILKKYGKRPILWNDSLESALLPENMQMQYWSVTYNEPSAAWMKRGGQWIYSDMFEMYLDYPHAMISVKKLYENRIDLGSCPYDEGMEPYGYEACIWTEQIRTKEELEQHLFPRVLVLAELAWYGAGDYEEFEERLKEEMEEVKKAGISVTAFEEWNPEGERRQREAFGYLAAMHAGLAEAEKGEVVDPSDVGEDFQKKFIGRFFEPEDLPVLMGNPKA